MKIKLFFIILTILFFSLLKNQIVNASGSFAYVGAREDGEGKMYVIDTSNDKVLIIPSPIRIGPSPSGIAVTNDGKKLYVADSSSGEVYVIDTSINRVIGNPIKVVKEDRHGAGSIAITPDGKKVYITCADTNYPSNDYVSVIDTSNNNQITTITVGRSPSDIAITPDGKRAYVANNDSKNVSVIDTANDTIVPGTPINVGPNPSGIAIDSKSEKVYVTNMGSNSVSVIDNSATPAPKVIGPPIDVGGITPVRILITSDGKKLYVTNMGTYRDLGSVSIIKTSDHALEGSIKIPNFPRGISMTPDGKKIYVIGSPGISVIDISNGNKITTILPENVNLSTYGHFITPFLSNSPLSITSPTTVSGKTGKPLTPYKITASGDNPEKFKYEVSPQTANGLSFNGKDTISGTPIESSIISFKLSVNNEITTASGDLQIVIAKYDPPLINSSLEANGKVGEPFTYKILAKGDPDYPDQPLTYNAGGLPFGLKVNRETGVISGSPEADGTFKVQLIVSNGETPTYKDLILSIAPSESSGCSLSNGFPIKTLGNHKFLFLGFISLMTIYLLMRVQKSKFHCF